MGETNRHVVLRRRPSGLVSPDDVEIVESPWPDLADGEALVRNTYAQVDAAVRTWLDGQPGYLPALELGDTVRAGTIGEVVESRCPALKVGDVVTSLGGFSEYAVARDDVFTTPVPADADRKAYMAIFGSTGATAYFGMHEIGRPAEGETVVVSAAAGATGSLAGQIAKAAGARVVGIAGGPEKCAVVVDEFGFDACIDHHADDLDAALRAHCPKRIDVYFDNVGGPILNAALGRLNLRGRVVLCGVISSYLTGEHPGPDNYVKLLAMRGRMEGFNTLDHWDRYDEANAFLHRLHDAGQLRYRAQVYPGLESAVDALNSLFLGTNIGKAIVGIDPDAR